ncbi:MAG: NUDIX hydrolase [Planctomycetes bacterium]|nr:NUDIX hydrolase [Planctomycetota bacterium]
MRSYRGVDEREEGHRKTILAQVEATPLWWHRDTLPGHVTASAYVVSPDLGQVLLHHHRKLGRWLQLGGHDDGERHPAKTVLREVQEESGLARFDFFGQPVIFDLDVHPIPAFGATPAHDHLDVRYLVVADPAEALRRDDAESLELRWFAFERARELLDEPGSRRALEKIGQLRGQWTAAEPAPDQRSSK